MGSRREVPSLQDGAAPGVGCAGAQDELDEITGETGAAPASARNKGQPRFTVMVGGGAGRVIAVDRGAAVIGRSRSADIQLLDDGVSRQHCRVVRTGDTVSVEDLGSRNGTLVNGKRVTRAMLEPGDRLQIGAAVLQLGMFDDTEETLARKLFEASTRDPLMRAFNRHYFSERLEAELSHARRHETPLSVMMLDIDGLKDVNAVHGVAVGDAVLRAVVEAVEKTIPKICSAVTAATSWRSSSASRSRRPRARRSACA
jgi:hypothetical protein